MPSTAMTSELCLEKTESNLDRRPYAVAVARLTGDNLLVCVHTCCQVSECPDSGLVSAVQ